MSARLLLLLSLLPSLLPTMASCRGKDTDPEAAAIDRELAQLSADPLRKGIALTGLQLICERRATATSGRARPPVGTPVDKKWSRVVDAMNELVREDADHLVRVDAAALLGCLRPPGRQQALLDCARNDGSYVVVDECVQALLASADDANLADLMAIVPDRPHLASRAVDDVRDAYGERARPYLEEIVRRDSERTADPSGYRFVVGSHITSLADEGDPFAVQLLALVMANPDREMSWKICKMLSDRDPGRRLLVAYQDSPDPRIAELARKAEEDLRESAVLARKRAELEAAARELTPDATVGDAGR